MSPVNHDMTLADLVQSSSRRFGTVRENFRVAVYEIAFFLTLPSSRYVNQRTGRLAGLDSAEIVAIAWAKEPLSRSLYPVATTTTLKTYCWL